MSQYAYADLLFGEVQLFASLFVKQMVVKRPKNWSKNLATNFLMLDQRSQVNILRQRLDGRLQDL